MEVVENGALYVGTTLFAMKEKAYYFSDRMLVYLASSIYYVNAYICIYIYIFIYEHFVN